MFLILALYTPFLTTLYFNNLSRSNLSTLLFKLLKLFGTFLNLSISKLSTLDFKLAKSVFYAKFDVWTPATFFISAFDA